MVRALISAAVSCALSIGTIICGGGGGGGGEGDGGGDIHLSDYEGAAVFDGPIPGPEIPVWPHLREEGVMPGAPTIGVVDGWQSQLEVLSIEDHWCSDDDTPLLLRVSDIDDVRMHNLVVDAGRYALWMDGQFGSIVVRDSTFTTYDVGVVESLFRGPYDAWMLAFMGCSFEHIKWKPILRVYGVEDLVLIYDCDFTGSQLTFGGADGTPCESSNPIGFVYLINVDHDTTMVELLTSPIAVREADALVLINYVLETAYPHKAFEVETGIPILDMGGNVINGEPFDEDVHVLRLAPCP